MMARSIEILEMYDRYSQHNRLRRFFNPSKAVETTTHTSVLKYTRSGDNEAAVYTPAKSVPTDAGRSRAVKEKAVQRRAVKESTFSTPFQDSSSGFQWKSTETVAFTGHRPEKLPWGTDENSPAAVLYKFRLREALEYMIGRGYTTFLSGAARGFDTMAAEIVLSLREVYPWVRLIVVLPCADQAKKWSDDDRARWENIILNSDHVETLQQSFTRSCMFKRNRYLVDHSSVVFACFNGDQHSGTAMTVNYAHQKNVKVRRLKLEKNVCNRQ